MNKSFVRSAPYIAAAIMLLGISVLIGWQFDIVVLKSIVPGIVTMNPLTAVTFIVLASSLLIYAMHSKSRAVQYWMFAAGGFAIGIGAIRIVGIITGFDFHVDQIIFHQKILAATVFSNSRIAPNTALNFILIGGSIISLARGVFPKVWQSFAIVTAMIALLAILGYFYSVSNLYGFLSYTPMALNTAIAFILTAVTILISSAHRGYMQVVSSEGVGGATARRLIPAVIVVPSLLGWLRLLGEKQGYFNTEYGSSLLVWTLIGIFICSVYWLAKRLEKADADRRTAQAALEKVNGALDKRLQDAEKQNTSLAQTKLATINLLEDLESEKDKIAASRAKDEAVLQSIGEGLIETDAHGTIMRMNASAENLLGVSGKDTVGKQLVEAIHMTDEKNVPVPFQKRPGTLAIISGKAISGVYNYFRADGSTFSASITVTPVKIDDEIIGTIEVFHDVTHEMEVDRAKTEFVSLASHQLRTPLTSINWYAEMLLAGDAGKLKPDQEQFVQEIYTGNHRMVDLVNALLNVSRIDLGTFSIEPEMTDLREIGDSLLQEMQPQILAKKMHMEKAYKKDMPELMTDPKLMRIVIQNLLTNAVKYTAPEGTVTLTIDTKGTSALISVADNGYGIPKAQQDKIFSKLFRADNVREKETDGTGLGLYIIKAVVEQSGGKTWFTSEENKGTTFYVTIPLKGMKKKAGTKGLS